MAAWCLPQKYASAFLDALKDGRIDPFAMRSMSSAERRDLLAEFVGAEHAPEVNAQFESKMLLKDQQRGLVTWAKKIAGITEAARADIVSKINNMDRVLQPADELSFLADLAAKKLGVSVSAQEAQAIFDLSQKAEAAKTVMTADRAAPGYVPLSFHQTMNLGMKSPSIAYARAVQDLSEYIDSLKPNYRSWGDRALDILSIPKSALTSVLHFSALGVQGWGMVSTARAWEAFAEQFRYFANEENYKNLNAYIMSHPDYALAMDGKLGLTKLGDKLSSREEAIQSSLLESANKYLSDKTGVPNLIRASSRAFTGFLNTVRFNRFADLLNAARLNGEDVRVGSSVVRDLAKVVNDFTGRGELTVDITGKAPPTAGLEGVTKVLNAIFFAPRKIAATVHMFNPVRYLNPAISPTARLAAIRQLSGSLIATGAVLSLARAMGASVDIDPRSSDFLKIGIGGEKLDITGGNAIYLRLWARLIANQEVTASGKTLELGHPHEPGGTSASRADQIAKFFRGKLAPVIGTAVDSLYGSDPVGRPFSVTQEAADKLLPITANSWWEFYKNNPDDTVAILPALSAVFGVGLESPLPPRVESGRTIWGEPEGSYVNPRDPVNMELTRLGYSPGFPATTIRKVILTPEQFDNYVRLSGRLTKMRLDHLVAMPQWSDFPDARKLSLMQRAVRKGRDAAQTAILMQSQGTAHDIVRLAHDRKLAIYAQPAAEPSPAP